MKTLAAIAILLSMAPEGAAAEAGPARFHALYLSGDYETALRDAAGIEAEAREDVEQRAWIVASRVQAGKAEDALREAKELTAAYPGNAWSWFALSRAREGTNDPSGRLEASGRMMTSADAPRPELVVERADALEGANRKKEAVALLDGALARAPGDAVLLTGRAKHEAGEQQLALLAKARKADPGYLAAWSYAGSALVEQRRGGEAFELLKHATELSPRALNTRRMFWRAIHTRADLTQEQKEQALEADIDAFIRDRGDLYSTFAAVAREYHELKLDARAVEAEERVLREAPGSDAAASVLLARASAFRHEHPGKQMEQPANVAEYRRLLHALVDDPHHNTSFDGTAYLSLFSTMTGDRSVPPEELRATVEKLVLYEHDSPEWLYVHAPLALADRGIALGYAESLARQGEPKLQAVVEADRAYYESEEDYQRSLAASAGSAHDALGWVLFKEKKLAAAKKELLAAYEGDPFNARILYHLGRYYESRGQTAKAEELYTKGNLLQNVFRNENAAALKAVYRKRHGGSLAGFAAFRKNLDSSSTAKQKKQVLASRSRSPRAAPPFRLATLRGGPLSLDDLKGKVAVINFWGIWCSWCVRELPDLQALVHRYAKDPEVRIVTINNDGDADKVRGWMASKKYEFPVLMDDGWISKAGMHSYPTTWFLDPKGRVAFTKRGFSEKLVEEFSWRIEALKGK